MASLSRSFWKFDEIFLKTDKNQKSFSTFWKGCNISNSKASSINDDMVQKERGEGVWELAKSYKFLDKFLSKKVQKLFNYPIFNSNLIQKI